MPVALARLVVRGLVRPALGPSVPVPWQRRWLELVTALTPLPSGIRRTRGRLAGRPVERLSPGEEAGAARAVLYLHGGGFTVGSPATHRALAAHLAAASGTPVHLLDYRLAPEHPHPAALEDTVAAYRELMDRGLRPENLALAGDSAGGWLALSAALALRDDGVPLPATLVLISPWLDLALTDPSATDDEHDPMLRAGWLRACAARYAPDLDPTSPELSPLDADLTGLPPIAVQYGEQEILGTDALRLANAARSAGVPVDIRRLDGLWHDAHTQAGLVAEATTAVAALGRHVDQATRSDPPTQSPGGRRG
jgi:monoterpene epsilon-lactone hydrolase